jgi:hypothetical protein
MCSRKCGTGLKRIVVLSVLLVLLVGSLSAAWPWAWGKEAVEPQVVEKIVTVYVEKPIPAGMVLLEESLWTELKAQLTARETALTDLKTSYEAELKTLKNEIATLQVLSPISTEVYDEAIAEESPNKLGGMVGASALYRMADGKIGAELEAGIRWDRLTFKVGAGYIPDTWEVRVPALDELTIKAGMMLSY